MTIASDSSNASSSNSTERYSCNACRESLKAIPVVCFAFVSLLANILALLVLLRPRLRSEFSNFRKHLVLVTVLEIAFCFSFVVMYCFSIGRSCDPNYKSLEQLDVILLTLVFPSFILVTHHARNWAVAAITLARTEAVVQPLRLRGRRICTTLRMVIFVVAVSLISLSTFLACLLYSSPSPRDLSTSRMPSSA